jgi:hypothetical protein
MPLYYPPKLPDVFIPKTVKSTSVILPPLGKTLIPEISENPALYLKPKVVTPICVF